MELYAMVASIPPPQERAPSNLSTEAGWAMQLVDTFWKSEKSLACVGS
jgi:hypothetical protein